jgi:TolB-like protein
MNLRALFLLLCAGFATAATPPKVERKTTVAVLAFTGSFKQFSAEEFTAVTNRFETELMKTGTVQVLERRNMDAILQEQGFQQTGACTSECQVQVGQLLGVDRIISGDIGKVGDMITMNLKLVDVENGANVMSHAIDIKGDLQTVLRGGCYEMAQIFSGLKKPANDHSVLTAEKSSVWPWVVGGVAIVAGAMTTVVILSQDNSGSAKNPYTVDTGF